MALAGLDLALAGLVRLRLVWPVWFGSGWFGSDWFGSFGYTYYAKYIFIFVF
jgi:hypothetical protein